MQREKLILHKPLTYDDDNAIYVPNISWNQCCGTKDFLIIAAGQLGRPRAMSLDSILIVSPDFSHPMGGYVMNTYLYPPDLVYLF